MIQTTTLRAQAREAIETELREALIRSHAHNHHKLHVERDGTLCWREYADSLSDTIDEGAKHFAPIPSVLRVGAGSTDCNCDYCNQVGDPGGYETKREAWEDAAANEDGNDMLEMMRRKFDAIEMGYFDDEAAR